VHADLASDGRQPLDQATSLDYESVVKVATMHIHHRRSFAKLECGPMPQRHGRPAEYRWRHLQKFRNSIPCIPHHKVWLTAAARVPYSNAGNIGERKSWTKVKFAPGKIPSGARAPPQKKMYTLCFIKKGQ